METIIKNNSCTTNLINQIKKNVKDYKILSKEEEQELIDQYKDTDPVKLRQLLINHNIRLVFSIAKKYVATCDDFDELIGRGMEGLSIAASRFDFDRNNKFSTYAYTWIFKYIVGEYYTSDSKISKSGISMNQSLGNEEDATFTFDNFVNANVDPIYTVSSCNLQAELSAHEMQNTYDRLIDIVATDPSFDETDKYIFQKTYVDEKKSSIRAISVDLGLPTNLVQKKRNDIVDKLRTVLSNQLGIHSMEDFTTF